MGDLSVDEPSVMSTGRARAPKPWNLRTKLRMLIVPSNVAGASTSARAAFVQDGSSGADDVIPLQLLYSPDSLVQRLVAMFLGETEAPRESGKGRLASDARLELVVAADVARVRFWKAHEHEVTRACAPALIDKQEVFAYLLADVLGRPLLPPDETRGVGRRGDNAAAKAKSLLKVKAKKEVAEACWRALSSKPKALALQPPYDLKLPSATVCAKRTAEQWAARESKAAAAKSAKLMARYDAAKAEHDAASGAAERKHQLCLETYAATRGDCSAGSQKRAEHAHAASDAADARRDAARIAAIEAGEAALEAIQNKAAADAVLATEVPSAEDSDEEQPVWEWDLHGSGSSQAEIRAELELVMCGVAVAEAGFASCAHCAYLLIQNAQDLVLDMEDELQPLELTDAFRDAWDRSRLLTDTIITAESWVVAVGSTPCCTRCATHRVRNNVLTATGEEAGRVAAAGAAEARSIAWLQRRKWPERAREADIWKHGTFGWDAERQGHVLVSVPAWLGDLDAARCCLMQVMCLPYAHASPRVRTHMQL